LGVQELSCKNSEIIHYFVYCTYKPKKNSKERVLTEKLIGPQPVREVTLDILCLGVKGEIE